MSKRRYRLPEAPSCVVTGGGSGIGRAFCLELACLGGTTIIADLKLECAEETAALVRRLGGHALAVECDVASPDDVRGLAETSLTALGRVDLLVNNAGSITAGAIGDVALEDWHHVVDVNLWGVIYGCHYFVPILRKQGRGLVINVASVAGLVSTPELGPYNVSKAAVVSLSATLATELSQTDVGVTVLTPSMVKTSLLNRMRTPDSTLRDMGARLMSKTGVTPESIAKAALRGAQRGQLYVVPQWDAKLLWSLQRITPTLERWLAKRLYGSGWLSRQRALGPDEKPEEA